MWKGWSSVGGAARVVGVEDLAVDRRLELVVRGVEREGEGALAGDLGIREILGGARGHRAGQCGCRLGARTADLDLGELGVRQQHEALVVLARAQRVLARLSALDKDVEALAGRQDQVIGAGHLPDR